MASHEFVIAVKRWLGIPIFPDFPEAIRCMRGHTIDSFGDHLLECGHDSLRSRCHNAIRDIVYHTLLVDDAGSRVEECCSSTSFNRPGKVYHPNFTNGKPAYFDVSIWNTMQPSYIIPSSTLAEAAAFAEGEEKDAHHQADVEAANGCFYPLIVEMFDSWTPASLATLRIIASKTMTKTRLHLLKRLVAC
ncbi:uncharacterized protein LOC134193447 [Corticium candelabrum]|uniref:uncharacterized protein LOC134193447 n=1 Tax=Corticium candelabrum TaxID=121492 RepID=UPI002E265BC3|nr:uncharacterized protein LOC134193447 [Corticium candelabrum]